MRPLALGLLPFSVNLGETALSQVTFNPLCLCLSALAGHAANSKLWISVRMPAACAEHGPTHPIPDSGL